MEAGDSGVEAGGVEACTPSKKKHELIDQKKYSVRVSFTRCFFFNFPFLFCCLMSFVSTSGDTFGAEGVVLT